MVKSTLNTSATVTMICFWDSLNQITMGGTCKMDAWRNHRLYCKFCQMAVPTYNQIQELE